MSPRARQLTAAFTCLFLTSIAGLSAPAAPTTPANPPSVAAPAENIAAGAQGLLVRVSNLAPTSGEVRRKTLSRPFVVGDRKEYWADDEAAQFYISLPTTAPAPTAEPTAAADADGDDDDAATKPAETQPQRTEAQLVLESEQAPGGMAPIVVVPPPTPLAAKLVVEFASLANGQATVRDRAEVANPLFPKTHARLLPAKLAPGEYQVSAWLESATGEKSVSASWTFRKSDKKTNALAFPAQGLPITIEPIADTRKISIPMRLAVPLPLGLVHDLSELSVTRDGKSVPAQFTVNATWAPTEVGASIRWALAEFNADYADGKAEGYKLERRKSESTPGVRVEQKPDSITVDNGSVKFVVNRRKFTGIERAWFDATGAGKYDEKSPVIVANPAESGPFLMDERLVKFSSSADAQTSVTVEESGPRRVTLLATGWYADPLRRVGPLCLYQVRFTLRAGQPDVEVTHNTVITYDTRLHKLRNLGFGVTYPNAERYAFGVDGGGVVGALPQTDAKKSKRVGEQPTHYGVYMHQKKWDLCTVRKEDGKSVDGKHSDGWAATWSDNQPVLNVTLRDIWERFPKELEARQDGLFVHAWPKNGARVFQPEEELELKNIYKFWCFHQNPMLDLNLPQNYFEKLMTLSDDETRECRPEHGLNGNGQGMTISTHFSLRFAGPTIDKAADAPELVARCRADAKLFDLDPYATLPASWNAATSAVEPMAPKGERFDAFEESILRGLVAYNGSVERNDEYGMFIWPDTHTYWLVDQNRASLHRVWQNSHYHQVGNSWVLWFRSGSPQMLRWARSNSEHFRNVGTIAYAEPESAATAIKFHLPGAMYHCKGCTPWGSEVNGMIRRDTHAGLWGHWVDSDAHLWAWYMDGNARAKDLYQLWVRSLKTYGYLTHGTRREANNTLAMILSAYQATWDPDFLPAIWGLGLTLRTAEPLEKQNPGPMWHPNWITRYYHQTRDPEYVPFILQYGRSVFMGNTWNLALAALAYEVSGDKSYLVAHLPGIKEFPRKLYRQPGSPFDGFGQGPGPLGMNWAEMGVGAYMLAARNAGIDSFPADLPETTGVVPVALGRKPYSQLYAYSEKGGQIAFKSSAIGVEGDCNRGDFVAADATGKTLGTQPVTPGWSRGVAADLAVAPGSLTTLTFQGYGSLSMARAGFDHVASLINAESGYGISKGYALLDAFGNAGATTLNFTATQAFGSDRSFCSVVLTDAKGQPIANGSMHMHLDQKSLSVVIDPTKHPLPWRIDTRGALRFSIQSDVKKWILAPNATDMAKMKPMLQKQAESK